MKALSILAWVLYPFVIYWGLTRGSLSWASVAVLVLLLLQLLPRIREARARGQISKQELWSMLSVPLTIACLVSIAAVSKSPRLLLAQPVFVNGLLLLHFASSLRTPVSRIEQFAQMWKGPLPPQGKAYCRQVTKVWCGFFIVNGTICALLAMAAPLSWWMLYTGLLSYILIGLLFAGEWLVRTWLFRTSKVAHATGSQ